MLQLQGFGELETSNFWLTMNHHHVLPASHCFVRAQKAVEMKAKSEERAEEEGKFFIFCRKFKIP
jgi:hypothetical protein